MDEKLCIGYRVACHAKSKMSFAEALTPTSCLLTNVQWSKKVKLIYSSALYDFEKTIASMEICGIFF